MSIVKYWWTLDRAEELCQMKTITSQDNLRCYNCEMVLEQGINIKELEPLRRINYKYIPEHIQPKKYYICIGCSKLHIENVPGRNNINYEELIQLLKTANTVDEINNRRYEIGALLPSIYIMFGYLQGNLAHQYDLWEHCVHTVLNLPKDVDDDMLYLAALLHDIGKPECMTLGKDDRDSNVHYYGHPKVSMEIVRDEVIPCLEAAGVCLSMEDKKRLLYYVEYHDYRFSRREKHLKKHLGMVSPKELKHLLLLEIADAKAHVMLAFVEERIQICEGWLRVLENYVD